MLFSLFVIQKPPHASGWSLLVSNAHIQFCATFVFRLPDIQASVHCIRDRVEIRCHDNIWFLRVTANHLVHSLCFARPHHGINYCYYLHHLLQNICTTIFCWGWFYILLRCLYPFLYVSSNSSCLSDKASLWFRNLEKLCSSIPTFAATYFDFKPLSFRNSFVSFAACSCFRNILITSKQKNKPEHTNYCTMATENVYWFVPQQHEREKIYLLNQ